MSSNNKQLEKMTEQFMSFSHEKKMEVLNINDNVINRHKYQPIDSLIMDKWNGLSNSQRRKILKNNK